MSVPPFRMPQAPPLGLVCPVKPGAQISLDAFIATLEVSHPLTKEELRAEVIAWGM